jgi:hypothetical protein
MVLTVRQVWDGGPDPGGVTMRRLSGVVLAGAILMLPAFSQNAGVQAQAPQKLTMEGDLALWSVAIRPDKTGDFEKIMAKIKDALTKSTAPEAKQQLAGWRVVKMSKPMPDGNIIYTHVITPVAGADYNILQVLYGTFTDPAEQKELYEMYRGAFAANLGISSGGVAVDLSK